MELLIYQNGKITLHSHIGISKKILGILRSPVIKIDWGNNIEMDPDSFYLKLINKTFEEYAGDSPSTLERVRVR